MDALLVSTVTVALAEIGDKTQLPALLLAARYRKPWLTIAGTTVGMMLANMPVVLLGARYSDRLPLQAARWEAASLFVAMALWVAWFGLSSDSVLPSGYAGH